jgi:hypothetical protein
VWLTGASRGFDPGADQETRPDEEL